MHMRQKRPIVQQIVWQSTLNFKCFDHGVLNGVLIGILVYLKDGISISS